MNFFLSIIFTQYQSIYNVVYLFCRGSTILLSWNIWSFLGRKATRICAVSRTISTRTAQDLRLGENKNIIQSPFSLLMLYQIKFYIFIVAYRKIQSARTFVLFYG